MEEVAFFRQEPFNKQGVIDNFFKSCNQNSDILHNNFCCCKT